MKALKEGIDGEGTEWQKYQRETFGFNGVNWQRSEGT
jgi:hypothetical protein